MIKLNLPKGDGPLEQIEECLRVIKEMENLVHLLLKKNPARLKYLNSKYPFL